MTSADTLEDGQKPVQRPNGSPFRNVTSVRSASMLGMGMVIGAVLGAGIAMLVAPQSGPEMRRVISRRANGLRHRGGVWTKLGRELRRAAAAKRKSLEMESRRNEVEARRNEVEARRNEVEARRAVRGQATPV